MTKELLEHPDTPATTLLAICVDLWGFECLEFEGETILDLFKGLGVTVPEVNMDKIHALQVVYTTDLFYKDLAVFRVLVDSLVGAGASFMEADPPTSSEIAIAVAEVIANEPPTAPLHELFTPEIQKFVRILLDEEGFDKAPPILAWAGNKAHTNPDSLKDPITYAAYHKSQVRLREDLDADVTEFMSILLRAVDMVQLRNRDQSHWDEYRQQLGL